MDPSHILRLSKMATNGVHSGTTDFSIDHILNRAGERFLVNQNRRNQFETISSASSSGDESSCDNFKKNCYRNEFSGRESFIEIPTFSWLNYTRYNMPRISRPVKGPVKRTPGRLPRIPFTSYQLSELEQAYVNSTYLSTEDANKLAKKLELTGVRVKIWFQNRRARDRRERKILNKNVSETSLDSNEEEIIVA